MARPRTSRSTIGRDPFEAVIPVPEPEPPTAPRRRGRPRSTTTGEPTTVANHDAPGTTAFALAPPAPAPVVPSVAPEPAVAPAQPKRKQKLTVHLDDELLNRVKNAAYWNPRLTIAKIAEEGIRVALARVEKENGGPYPRRESELVGGRPIK